MKCIAILVLLTPLVTGAVIKKWHKSDDGSLYYVENEQKVRYPYIHTFIDTDTYKS